MNEKLYKKKIRKDLEKKEFVFRNVDARINNSERGVDLILQIPIREVERFDGPMFNETFIDYCRSYSIPNSTLDIIVDKFYDEMQNQMIVEYLLEHLRN